MQMDGKRRRENENGEGSEKGDDLSGGPRPVGLSFLLRSGPGAVRRLVSVDGDCRNALK